VCKREANRPGNHPAGVRIFPPTSWPPGAGRYAGRMEERILALLRREDSRGDVEGLTPEELAKETGAAVDQVQRALDDLAAHGEVHLLGAYWYARRG